MYTDKLVSTMQKIRLKEYSTHNTMLCRDKQSSLDTASSTEQSAQNSTTEEDENKAKAGQNGSFLLQDLSLPAGHSPAPCSQIFDVPMLFYI